MFYGWYGRVYQEMPDYVAKLGMHQVAYYTEISEGREDNEEFTGFIKARGEEGLNRLMFALTCLYDDIDADGGIGPRTLTALERGNCIKSLQRILNVLNRQGKIMKMNVLLADRMFDFGINAGLEIALDIYNKLWWQRMRLDQGVTELTAREYGYKGDMRDLSVNIEAGYVNNPKDLGKATNRSTQEVIVVDRWSKEGIIRAKA
ncbi:hypothetical protein SPFM20_00122 [Salmonella phage SPFM20]|nr:hypothetical protein SPFM20_00122 [Salmonella phage SPFM20]